LSFDPKSYNASKAFDTKDLIDEVKPVQSLKYTYKPMEKWERIKV